MMGYSTKSKGYKICDADSSKLVVSRDVTFNESSVNPPEVHIQSNEVTDSNVADSGGESVRDVDSNIELSLDTSEESESTENNDENEFEDAQGSPLQQPSSPESPSPAQQLRRSFRVRKQTSE